MRVSIEEVAEVKIGYQAREALRVSPDGTHYVIQAKDVESDFGYDLATSSLERSSPSRNADSYIVHNGDILFLARGRRRSATVVKNLPPQSPSLALNHFFILRLKQATTNPDFIAWVINEGPARDYLASVATGIGIPFVSKKDFSALRLELPSLDAQANIARMYRLAMKEMRLARQLEQKRVEIVRSACLDLYGQSEEDA